MSLIELLLAEVERVRAALLAEWHAERAPLDDRHLAAYEAMLVVGIVLRELEDALFIEQ
jgi:hypothetical protein